MNPEEVQIVIEQIDIPQTEQFDRPPPPARPSVPVESESEDVADDVLKVLAVAGMQYYQELREEFK